jgi:hypothetical protein
MKGTHIKYYIHALKNAKEKEDIEGILKDLSEDFMPWIIFSKELLPIIEGLCSRAQESFWQAKGMKNQRYTMGVLNEYGKMKKVGLLMEEEFHVLNSKILAAKKFLFNYTGSANHALTDTSLKELLAYLVDLEKKIESEEEIIEKLIREIKLFSKVLQSRVDAIEMAEENLTKLKKKFRKIE